MQKEAAGTAGRVQNIPVMLRLHHFYCKLYNGARREILTEISFEKAVHELLKRNAFHIEVGFAQVHCLQVRYDRAQYPIIDLDGVREHLGVFYLLLIVEIVDPFGQLGRGFMSFDLELVGLAFLPWLLFIADFDKYEFAELAKSGRWRQPAAAPKRIVAFLDSSNQKHTYQLNERR